MKNKNTEQKLRGGYYTPQKLAQFLVEWAIPAKAKNISILEPSLGDGVFVDALNDFALKNSSSNLELVGVELFKEELAKAKRRLTSNDLRDKSELIVGDFFSIYEEKLSDKKFDLILGNPPFIRYQDFPEVQRDKALKILKEIGFKPNKLTNAWLFFLLVTVEMLSEKGKLAMVLPAELLQVKYAEEARKFLSKIFHSITLISFKKLLFDGTQQEVVLLLGEKDNKRNNGIDLIELNDLNDLADLHNKLQQPDHFKPIDHGNDKWLQYFLSKEEIVLLKDLSLNKKLTAFGQLAEVDVGVVTGNNKFFVVNKGIVEKYKLDNYCIPLVGRTEQLKSGIIYQKSDWQNYVDIGKDNYLLKCSDSYETLPDGLKEYLEIGLDLKVREGYKCSIRKIWYSVPSIWIPDAFMYRQIHNYPKVVLNNSGAVSTDTIHRVKIKDQVKADDIISSFHNSLTFAFSEVYGRSYGGGVLELEPNEAERLPVPYFPESNLSITNINNILINKGIDQALDYVDTVLLEQKLGITKKNVLILRSIWKKLSDRRINRKKQ